MDYHALQQKLFEMDPSDPADDIRKLTEMASENPTPVTESLVDGHGDVHDIPQGSVPIDRDYSVSDFAKLAGVTLNEADDNIQTKFTKSFAKGFKNPNVLDPNEFVKGKVTKSLGIGDKEKTPTPTQNKTSGNPVQKQQDYKSFLSQYSKQLQAIASDPKKKREFDNFMKKVSEGSKKPKPIKARDPNWRDMEALRKSGAGGSHKDKTKTIPRKQKYKDTNESIKSQLWAALKSK